MALSDNARAALIGVGGAVCAFFVFRGSSPAAQLDPLDAIPSGSFLVASVDMAALQKSPMYQSMLGENGASRMLGMGSLVESCGFDPITRVSKIAIAVPDENPKGEFGLAAKINVSGAELEACTKGLSNGKSLETKQVGSYVIVESPNGSRIAYGKGLLLVGRGTWLESMMATAEKKNPSTKDDPKHAEMRRTMGAKQPSSTLVMTAVLPKSLRDRLRAEMKTEVEDQDDESTRVFQGVLGVDTAGLALDTGEKTTLEIELGCDTPESCAAVEKLVLAKKAEWTRDIRFRIVGITPIVETLAVVRKGDHLSASMSADSKALAATIQKVTSLGNRPPPSMSAMPHPPRNVPRP